MMTDVSVSTTYFVGAHYELTNPSTGSGQSGVVTKYYFAGTTRIAMRKYIVPQSDTLTYLLGDHLGSTSLTVDAATSEVIETRYKAWGEVRYTTPNKTLPTRNTFTGQFSYVADEATDLGNSGFGLMFYQSRFYDPSLGRFAQADSVVPGGVQGMDRYAYVNNNPLRYTDPTGHMNCEDDGYNCTKADIDKIKMAYKITSQFTNITINAITKWSLSQLQEIYNSLTKLVTAFKSQQNFEHAVGSLVFNLVDKSTFSDPNIAAESEWDKGIINMSSDAFGTSLGQGWYIFHEVGHVFDYKNSGGDSSKYKSQTFVNAFMGGNCNLSHFGCESYAPPKDTTAYGLNNSVEDFAEVFAAVIISGGGKYRSMTSQRRVDIMNAYLSVDIDSNSR